MRKITVVFFFILANLLFVVTAHADTISTSTPTSTPLGENFLTGSTSDRMSDATSTPSEENPLAGSTPEIMLTSEPATTTPLLVERIHAAKALLADISLDYAITPNYKIQKLVDGKTKKIITSYSAYDKEIALAIYDPATDQIGITKGIQNGKKFVFSDTAFSIQAVGFNGVNTRFVVKRPEKGIVVALKYLIAPDTAGSKKIITSQAREVLYVPYSDALNTDEMYAYGNQYIDSAIREAADQLQAVASKISPGQSIAEAISATIIKSLLYAEHIDEAQFLTSPNPQSLLGRINVLFAANEEDTFNYSTSAKSAHGIAQFIPSTYRSLVKQYPEAGLISDFTKGTENHVNAIKAAYLLVDDYTAHVKKGVSDLYQDDASAAYGAAAYNGGVTRVVRAVKRFGDTWFQDHASDISQAQRAVANQKTAIKQLNADYKKAQTAKEKKTLKTKLQSAEAQLKKLNADVTAAQRAALRRETVVYVSKIQKLLTLFTIQS